MQKAIYGSVVILRGLCPDCQDVSMIVDGAFRCCGRDAKIADANTTETRMSQSRARRPLLGEGEKALILESQGGECLYCGIKFGDQFWDKNRREYLVAEVCYDHFIPWSFARNGSIANMVAACGECNRYKADLIFDSIDDARAHIGKERGIIMRKHARKDFGSITCESCDKQFVAKREGQKFCSQQCRVDNSNDQRYRAFEHFKVCPLCQSPQSRGKLTIAGTEFDVVLDPEMPNNEIRMTCEQTGQSVTMRFGGEE
tara:strand:- start:403 stop:1173 length:771 start_codon:yes stop_codon:yes gene_type:complete